MAAWTAERVTDLLFNHVPWVLLPLSPDASIHSIYSRSQNVSLRQALRACEYQVITVVSIQPKPFKALHVIQFSWEIGKCGALCFVSSSCGVSLCCYGAELIDGLLFIQPSFSTIFYVYSLHPLIQCLLHGHRPCPQTSRRYPNMALTKA